MGRASNRKQERRQPVDYLGRLRQKVCLRCGGGIRWPKHEKPGDPLWCVRCAKKVIPGTAVYEEPGSDYLDWLIEILDGGDQQVDGDDPDGASHAQPE